VIVRIMDAIYIVLNVEVQKVGFVYMFKFESQALGS